MSRTFKDRPYWVRSNDKNELRSVSHYHHLAGEEVYHWLPVKDADGNQVMETVERPPVKGYRVVFRDRTSKVYTTTEYFKLRESGELNWYNFYDLQPTEIITTYERPLREKTLVGHRPDHCTAENEQVRPVRYVGDELQELCYTWVDSHRRAARPFKKDLKTQYHSSQRATERLMLEAMAEDYNDGDDLWGDDYDAVNTRQQRHVGYWN
jgi:hypothetical protein